GGLRRLVDRDEAVVEPTNGEPVLLLQQRVADGLQPEERGQLVEPLLVQREILLERLEMQRDVADPRLQAADARRDVGDLAAQRRLALLLPGEPAVEGCDLRVDRVLLPVALAE